MAPNNTDRRWREYSRELPIQSQEPSFSFITLEGVGNHELGKTQVPRRKFLGMNNWSLLPLPSISFSLTWVSHLASDPPAPVIWLQHQLKFQSHLMNKIKARTSLSRHFISALRSIWKIIFCPSKPLNIELFLRWEMFMFSVVFTSVPCLLHTAPSPPVPSPCLHYWTTISNLSTSRIIYKIMNWFFLPPF